MATSYPILAGVRFKDIPGFSGYCVGDNGTIWTSNTSGRGGGRGVGPWRQLAFRRAPKSGRLSVQIHDDAGRRRFPDVARLVLETFVGPCPLGMECCHDPDPSLTNNRVGNLRWDTRLENIEDARRLGLLNRGSRNGRAILNESSVAEIRRLVGLGVGRKDVARQFGVAVRTIGRVVTFEGWGNS